MRFYRTTARVNDGEVDVRWDATQAEAAASRKTFREAGISRSDISTTEVDVPTNKQGLLQFLRESEHV